MIYRSLFFVFIMVPVIIITVPTQFVVNKLRLPFWQAVPRFFHRVACAFLGLKVTVIGEPAHGRPTLLTSNHISWTDIVAIGSVADITFVAKSEVRDWPVVGFMADLQRTIYVDRKKRSDAGRTSAEMAEHMAAGNAVLLFAEGQSDLGTHVLPFRSALIGAAQQAMIEGGAKDVMIQPLTIAYTRLQGLPVSRTERSLIAWVKAKSVKQNIKDILSGPKKEVTVAFGTPRPLTAGTDRKVITKQAENEVRTMLVALNRGMPIAVTTQVPEPETVVE